MREEAEFDVSVTGTIFDFKRLATGDGPGVRGLIFLKGCLLRCRWCANPESQQTEPEIMYHREKCRDSGRCLQACPAGAIEKDDQFGLLVDDEQCELCADCVEACPYDALEVVGEEFKVGELLSKIRRDKSFYENSGGGITLTGGEPLYQPRFALELLKACKSYHIHTAIETSGYATWKCLSSLLPFLDLIFYDFKHIDSDLHKKYTGAGNERIKENLRKLSRGYEGSLIVRIPYIPEHNSSYQVQDRMIKYISELPHIKRVEIMPYHRLGLSKYQGTGRDYGLKELDAVNSREIEHLTELGDKYGIKVRIDAK